MDTPALATDTKQRRADRSVYRFPANDVKILVWITPMQQQDYSAFLVPCRRSHTVFAALAFAIPAQEGSELIRVEKQPRSTRYLYSERFVNADAPSFKARKVCNRVRNQHIREV